MSAPAMSTAAVSTDMSAGAVRHAATVYSHGTEGMGREIGLKSRSWAAISIYGRTDCNQRPSMPPKTKPQLQLGVSGAT